MKKAKVSITRPQQCGEGRIAIQIDDADSGLHVIRLEMALSDFAECITGLAASPASVDRIIGGTGLANLGKKRIVETVKCPRAGGFSKDEQKKIVNADFMEKYEHQGWILFSDGTASQQRGDQHIYVIVRFEEYHNGN